MRLFYIRTRKAISNVTKSERSIDCCYVRFIANLIFLTSNNLEVSGRVKMSGRS